MKDEYGTEIRNPETGKFEKVELPFYGDVTLGNMTMFRIAISSLPNGKCLVSVEGHGAYTFSHWVHFGYAMEKLGLLNGDAIHVADWINAQLGCDDRLNADYLKATDEKV